MMLVVERDPPPDPGLCLASSFESVQIDAFVLERPPQPLDHDVVHPPALAVHRDPNAGLLENLGKIQGGELALPGKGGVVEFTLTLEAEGRQ